MAKLIKNTNIFIGHDLGSVTATAAALQQLSSSTGAVGFKHLVQGPPEVVSWVGQAVPSTFPSK